MKAVTKDLLKSYPCKICSKIFPFDFVLQQHLDKEHTVKKETPEKETKPKLVKGKYDCKVCGKVFAYEHLVLKHFSTEHPLNCGTCYKKSKHKKSLAEHKLIHENRPLIFVCDFPGRFHLKAKL